MFTFLRSRLLRATTLALSFIATAAFLAPSALALTSASLTESALIGKTLTFTIAGGNAPFETSGTFTITFGAEIRTYTIPVSSGNAAFRSGFFNSLPTPTGVNLTFAGYQVNGTFVTCFIGETGNDNRSSFEMFAGNANKNGVVVFGSATPGGGGTTTVPVITSANAVTTTVGAPFTYQIGATNSPTSYTNSGGSAPIAINPTTGVVSGTFNNAGTFTFSFVANNASGASALTVVTVTASGGGTATVAPVVTSTNTVAGTVGTPFSYQIVATNSPASYNASGLPSGLSLNSTTGLLTGTPTSAGTFFFTLRAVNAIGSGARQMTFTVAGSADTGNVAGRYLGKLGSRVTSGSTVTTNTAFNDYEVLVTSSGGVTVNIGAIPAALTGTVSANGNVLFSGGTSFNLYLLANATIGTGPVFSSGYGTVTNGVAYRFEPSTAFASSTVVVAPVITSSSGLGGIVGNTLSYQIAATGTPTRYALVGAPAYLSVNAATGLVTGTPSAAGTFAFALAATNATGTGAANVVLTVAANSAAAATTTAPFNLTGYRNRVGQTFQFTVTGAATGAVWGTDVYTDDSFVATAAVHAGVLRVGETRTVTVTILAGLNSYPASTRNGIATSSWGSWGGSFSFAEAGTVTSAFAATAAPVAAPGFVAGTGTVVTGGRLVCPVSVGGVGPFTYRWYLNGILIPGATVNPYIVESTTSANAGTYSADVTNAAGTVRIVAGTVDIAAAGAPAFTLQPYNKVVAPGGTFALAANATGAGAAYQWLRNGRDLPGETGPVILRQNVNATDSGAYSVRITNASGSVTSEPANVTLNANAAVISNLSVRTAATPGQIITLGFTISGSGKKRVLIRAVGPGLTPFNVTGVMSDPRLTVFEGSTAIPGLANDDWAPASAAAFSAVGAFPLPTGSKDAALVVELDASASGRGYSIQATGVAGSSGIVLIEVYDLGNATGASKLTNVSVLTNAGLGNSTLILGLALSGEGQRTLLVRGVGPKLAAFGVGGLLADPRLQVFDSNQRVVITNNDWSGADFVSELVQASAYVGAFALDNNTSDSATLALLQPNTTYTVQLSGNDGGVGNALIEVYEVP